jgi:hypothetical protein
MIPPFPHLQFPGRYLAPPSVMAAGHLRQAPAAARPFHLPSPPSLLVTIKARSRAPAFPFAFALPAHALKQPPFTIAAASVPRRRRVFVAAGEGLTPPLSFLASWVRQGLTELVLPQDYVLGACRSHTLTTPERHPIRRRRQSSPPHHLPRRPARLRRP